MGSIKGAGSVKSMEAEADFKSYPTIETQEHSRQGAVGTFENESLESFYRPIDEYEGAHRFDPTFEWEKKEEQKIVRKVLYTDHPQRHGHDLTRPPDRQAHHDLGVPDVLCSSA